MKDSKIGQLSVCINEVREFMFYMIYSKQNSYYLLFKILLLGFYAGFHRQKHNYNIHGANVKR